MDSRLWYMNADFEAELAQPHGSYRRLPFFEALNRKLAPRLLWLTRPRDALLLDEEAWTDGLLREAARREVRLVSPAQEGAGEGRRFTPWGWTPSAAAAGRRAGAIVRALPFEMVARVNSKLWSHALEVELGVAQKGAALASTYEELAERVARGCPGASDKWVIKSPFGFAARERVLGRGPIIGEQQGRWARRRFNEGQTLIFQPWLDVVREYGVSMMISATGECEILGISDLQTNGAGTGTGYMLGRTPAPHRAEELERTARIVGQRLYAEGYFGPAGMDALEHAGGLHPVLEVNARYTMGFIALAVERSLKPTGPIFWSTK